MPDVVAKAMAVITGVLLVGTIAILAVTSRPPAGSRQVVAEFRDAFPIIEGMQVRANGAPAGSVGKTRVNDKGLATVTLLLDTTVPAPRADATATIRQFDSTGDSYIAYTPGTAAAPLAEQDGKPTIACDAPGPTSPCTNTLAAPRLDDLVNAFGPPEQAGVKLILRNLADALDSRGADVNRAALRLVPTLDAANTALAEVNGQNAALKSLITDMAAVSGQAASRRVQLGRLIGELRRTLATTAARTQGLDAGLQALPATQRELRGTLAGLTRAATAARPLADELATAAPRLSTLLDRAPSFIKDLRSALRQGGPTLDLTRQLLSAGAPTIAADPQRVVTGAFDLAPAVSNLLKGILGGDDTIKAFFGDDKNGGPESRPGYGFGLGAIASEPGDQVGFPGSWKDRNFLRVSAVLNCESFGVPVGPGCLAQSLARAERAHRPASGKAKSAPSRRRTPLLPKPLRIPEPVGKDPVAVAVTTVKDVVDGVRDTVDRAGKAIAPAPGGGDAESVGRLLDYLLR